jgi:hypothetical protein
VFGILAYCPFCNEMRWRQAETIPHRLPFGLDIPHKAESFYVFKNPGKSSEVVFRVGVDRVVPYKKQPVTAKKYTPWGIETLFKKYILFFGYAPT